MGNTINDQNTDQVQAKYVLELANGPVSDTAAQILESKKIVIIPDTIANAGGVIVSYLEWIQNKNNHIWSEEEVNSELEKYLTRAVEEVDNYSRAHNLSLKEAAIAIAIRRIIKAKRGIN